MRALQSRAVLTRGYQWSRQISSWQLNGATGTAEDAKLFEGCADQSLIPIGPGGVTLQLPVNSARQSARLPQFQATLPADLHSTVWQAFSKAPDDNPVDQPKTTYDRQDVPATKPGMDAPESPDATNPEIDRSDYSAPGTNPDVGHNDPEDYKPDSDDVEDLKRRGRTGKSKLPGGQKAGAHGLFASQLGLSVSGLVYGTAAQSGGATRRMHVFASSNSDEGNVGKDKSAGAVHPHLPGRSADDETDMSDAKTPTYDPQPDMMTDENLANKPKKPEKHKDGDTVAQDNTAMNNTSQGPKKQPEDIAPEQAGS